MNCDGVIFDLDGTLWDATRALTETWRLALSGQPDIGGGPPPPPPAKGGWGGLGPPR